MKKTLLAIPLILTTLCYAYGQDCSAIERVDSPRTGGVLLHSPLTEPFALMEYINGSDTFFVFRAELEGTVATNEPVGVSLFLVGHPPLVFADAKVRYAPQDGRHIYSIRKLISQSELTMLSTYKISTLKLSVFQAEVPQEKQKTYRQYANCLFAESGKKKGGETVKQAGN